MFVIFSGVSGSGKNTVINRLLEEADNRFLIKSATTRQSRGAADTNYELLTNEEFDRREANGEFFEVNEYSGYRYATQNKELKKIIENPQNLYFKDIDVLGTQKLVKYLKGKAKTLTIFLDATDEDLHARLLNRGETEERVQVRLSRAKMEREYMPLYDLVIENNNLEKTLQTIRERLAKEGF